MRRRRWMQPTRLPRRVRRRLPPADPGQQPARSCRQGPLLRAKGSATGAGGGGGSREWHVREAGRLGPAAGGARAAIRGAWFCAAAVW
jgi:hypothetical protein